MDIDINSTIEDTEDINVNNSPTVIDVIDLTKESPKIRPSQSHHRCTENASANHYATRSNRRTSRMEVLLPLVLGRRHNTQTEFPIMRRRRMVYDVTSNNEIVNLDDTIEDKNDKEADKNDKEADKQKTDKQEAEKYYTFQSDNIMPVSLTCPICLEILSASLKPTTTRCGHLFCAKCLEESVRKYKNCPTCKTTIKLKSCIRLYL